jgi:hypothetical protein
MASCAFCGQDESVAGKLFAGGGPRAARPGMPLVHICGRCAIQCAALLGEPIAVAANDGPSGAPPDPQVLVGWTPFVVDDRRLEWAAARVDLEGSPALLVSVRRPGHADSGVGVVYPVSTEPTVDRARDTARSFWRQLE